MPTRQLRRTDLNGRTRYLDAVFEEWKVAIEIDGAHHLDVGRMWDDADRQNALEVDGYTVLRFPALSCATAPSSSPPASGPLSWPGMARLIDDRVDVDPAGGVDINTNAEPRRGWRCGLGGGWRARGRRRGWWVGPLRTGYG